jgi:hypothetical protein
MRTEEQVVVRACLVLGALFVASYPLGLSPAALTWVHRSWQLLWVGVCLLLSYLIVRAMDGAGRWNVWSAVWLKVGVVAFVLLVLVGETSISASASYMFALPYQFGSGVGLVTADQRNAAMWMSANAPGAVIASDSDTEVVQWAYGGTRSASGEFPTWELTFADARPDGAERKAAREYGVKFLVVDRLMYREVSTTGYVYSPEEPHAFHESPVPVAAYDRLLRASWMRLVYSNRQMAIFRLLPQTRR